MSFETTTSLMQHQRAATAKMLPTRIGALFMDLGTGKTRVSIELVKLRAAKIDRVVWFCPVSLKRTIRDEVLKHTDLSPADVCVFDDKISEERMPQALFYICGIESMSASRRVILAINQLITDRTFVIVDEATYIKGHQSDRTCRITDYSIKARYRLLLTGTPLTQGIVDLYAQMRFLSPKILGFRSFYSFAANHLEYSEKYPDMIVRTHNVEQIAAKIAPYTYQVRKDECLDLPEKRHKTYYFEMTYEQRCLYDQAKREILADLTGDYFESQIAIFRLFTALQQVTCGFWSRTDEDGFKDRVEVPHKRLSTLLEAIRAIPADEKIIVWAKFHYDIAGIVHLLQKNNLGDVAQFHGHLTERQRNLELDHFRSRARFFVATPSAGGHGLTLNESAYAIYYNNGFKYSERLQSEDRQHRIGQYRSVLYTNITCCNSIDERIVRALIKKENVLESFQHEIEKVKGANLKERLVTL